MADKNIYLTAKYTAKPKNKQQTSQKGYMSNPDNVQYNEQVTIVRGLKSRDYQYQQVILNLTEEKIVKNTYNTGITFEESFKYFYDGYSEYIDTSVNTLNDSL
jgi:hypothetical protein